MQSKCLSICLFWLVAAMWSWLQHWFMRWHSGGLPCWNLMQNNPTHNPIPNKMTTKVIGHCGNDQWLCACTWNNWSQSQTADLVQPPQEWGRLCQKATLSLMRWPNSHWSLMEWLWESCLQIAMTKIEKRQPKMWAGKKTDSKPLLPPVAPLGPHPKWSKMWPKT